MNPRAAYGSVIIDVDSTIAGIEGVDWLAARRGPEVGAAVAALTERAMDGKVPLESVYVERLEMIQPTRADIDALAEAYQAAVAPGCAECLADLRDAGVRIYVVSGGIREAILPMVQALGLAASALHAVPIRFDEAGGYAGIDETSPLTRQDGKASLLASLKLAPPSLSVGDGATDLAMQAGTNAFAAFTGFVRRAPIVAAADHEVASFDALRALVIGDGGSA